jgi:hypothetical protein
MDQGGLFLDVRQTPGLRDQVVVKIQGRFDMYEYGFSDHTPQAGHHRERGTRSLPLVITFDPRQRAPAS